MSEKKYSEIYGPCRCSKCGATAPSATIGTYHLSCSGDCLPEEFDSSLQGRLILRWMSTEPGIWKRAVLEDDLTEFHILDFEENAA